MKKLKDVRRHNQAMEVSVKLDYKIKLFNYYNQLKKDNRLSDAEILKIFSELEVFMFDK